MINKSRKWLFYIVIIVINIGILELFSYFLYSIKYGEFSRTKNQLERIEAIRSIESGGVFTGENIDQLSSAPSIRTKEVIHPYYGYAIDGRQQIEACKENDKDIEPQCWKRFLLPEDREMPTRSDNTLNVALLGGSVAVGVIKGMQNPLLQQQLAKLPEYRGREVIIHLLASGGFRQPQPLMMLNYYLTLGAEYDLVLALDGFNEIAVPSSEYKQNKIHPAFPRAWNHRMASKPSIEILELHAQRLEINRKHINYAKLFAKPIIRSSITGNLIWKMLHGRYSNKTALLQHQLTFNENKSELPRELQMEELGPLYNFTNWEDLYKYVAKIWANSTALTAAAAKSSGAKFFHFIQPNQYIEGAKPIMSAAEKSISIIERGIGKGTYGFWYMDGYPHLKAEQESIKSLGIHSHDLTYLFMDTPDHIYIDSCCHVNEKGSAMIIQAMVDEIHRVNQHLANRQTN